MFVFMDLHNSAAAENLQVDFWKNEKGLRGGWLTQTKQFSDCLLSKIGELSNLKYMMHQIDWLYSFTVNTIIESDLLGIIPGR